MPVMKKNSESTAVMSDVKFSAVKLWKNNPRRNDQSVPKLMELLKVNGQRSRLGVWSKNMVIYKGNTTYKALCRLRDEWKEYEPGQNRELFDQVKAGVVKIELLEFKSEQSAEAYAISDNKASEWSEWDDKLLSTLMNKETFDFRASGFLADDVNRIKFSEMDIVRTEKSSPAEVALEQEKIVETSNVMEEIPHSDDYQTFIKTKLPIVAPLGFDIEKKMINPRLMDFQKDVVKWAVKKGRACIFSGTGTGKTLMQIEWGRLISEKTKKPVLILAPLAVNAQTIQIGKDLSVSIKSMRLDSDYDPKINLFIINYERLDKIDSSRFSAVILDESSIMKNFDGAIRNLLLEKFYKTPYKLCCTATPAPNDYMEIGTHAEFIGVMRRPEMLAMYFVHDGGRTSQWRLKRHARDDFWKWMASWSIVFEHPSDLGYEGKELDFFNLPELIYKTLVVDTGEKRAEESGVEGRLLNRKKSLDARVKEAVEIAGDILRTKKQACALWCDLNEESEKVATLLGIPEVKGSDDIDLKTKILESFSSGRDLGIVTKPSIAGFGLNWQHCYNTIFVGLSDSFEKYYQAIRRFWRAGQKNAVTVYIVVSDLERNVFHNIQRKEHEFKVMRDEMRKVMWEEILENLHGKKEISIAHKTATVNGSRSALYLGDCVDVMKTFDEGSIDYSIFSPPFASLYTYSDSPRDIGNCLNHNQFFSHFRFVTEQLYRVLAPGRNLSFHVANIPASKVRDGYIGIINFRDMMIREFQERGFIFHSEVTIWKNPVTEMQRTKALGLLHRQLKKDSAQCRQGYADYLITMRKPGDNKKPISNTDASFPVDEWREYASPVWMDINQSDTLQRTSAREYEDERHICPLQLEVIRRALRLWSRKGDLVLTPFAGIGSECVVALECERRLIGIELKESYFKQMRLNVEKFDKPIEKKRIPQKRK